MFRLNKLVKVAMVASLMTTASFATLALVDDSAAFAKSDKSKKDKSKKDKSKKDKSKKDKAKKAKKVQSSKAKKQKAAKFVKAPVKKAKKVAVVAEETVVATEEQELEGSKNVRAAIGALNAANASEQAFANASPNSRVGKIAAYRDQMREIEELQTEVTEAESLLAGIEQPTVSQEELDAAIEAANQNAQAYETEIREWETALQSVGGENEEIENNIALAQERLAEAEAQLAELQSQSGEIEAYEAAQAKVDDANAQLEEMHLEADDLLNNVANKPVTDEVLIELHRILGLQAPDFSDEEPVEEESVTQDEGVEEEENLEEIAKID